MQYKLERYDRSIFNMAGSLGYVSKPVLIINGN